MCHAHILSTVPMVESPPPPPPPLSSLFPTHARTPASIFSRIRYFIAFHAVTSSFSCTGVGIIRGLVVWTGCLVIDRIGDGDALRPPLSLSAYPEGKFALTSLQHCLYGMQITHPDCSCAWLSQFWIGQPTGSITVVRTHYVQCPAPPTAAWIPQLIVVCCGHQVCLAAEKCGHMNFDARSDMWWSSHGFHCLDATGADSPEFINIFMKVCEFCEPVTPQAALRFEPAFVTYGLL